MSDQHSHDPAQATSISPKNFTTFSVQDGFHLLAFLESSKEENIPSLSFSSSLILPQMNIGQTLAMEKKNTTIIEGTCLSELVKGKSFHATLGKISLVPKIDVSCRYHA